MKRFKSFENFESITNIEEIKKRLSDYLEQKRNIPSLITDIEYDDWIFVNTQLLTTVKNFLKQNNIDTDPQYSEIYKNFKNDWNTMLQKQVQAGLK